MKPKLMPGYVPYGTVHKPTIAALKEIKRKKNELARLLFTYYRSLSETNQKYIEIMMDDDDINGIV